MTIWVVVRSVKDYDDVFNWDEGEFATEAEAEAECDRRSLSAWSEETFWVDERN